MIKRISKLLPQITRIVCSNADRLIMPSSGQVSADIKSDGSLVTEIDKQMQLNLATELKLLLPEVKMLGEEMPSSDQLNIIQSNDSYWCLDPVDGTNNFYHAVPLYSVSLALVANGDVVLGIIYDPVRKECFSAIKGGAMMINNVPVDRATQPESLDACLASIDFKRLSIDARHSIVSSMPFKSQRNVGSCALEWAWLAAGRIQLLLHGGEKIWDYAAGTLLLEAAGGISSSGDGEHIFNATLNPRRVIAASTEQLFRDWRDYLKSIN